jgi:hypothetical protein
MAERNWVKDFLESSPWALGAIAIGAVLSFLITAVEGGLRVYDRITSNAPMPAIQIVETSGFLLVPVTKDMETLPLVRGAQAFGALFIDSDTKRIPLWPAKTLILNPTKEAINLHTCKMTVNLPSGRFEGVKYLGANAKIESTLYFLSDAAPPNTKGANQPISVSPNEAKHVRLYFLFPVLYHLREKPQTPAEQLKNWFENPVTMEVTCMDTARREIRALATIFESIVPAERRSQEKPRGTS